MSNFEEEPPSFVTPGRICCNWVTVDVPSITPLSKLSINKPVEHNDPRPTPNFEFPVYEAVEEEDKEIPDEIRRLLDQEERTIQPHKEVLELINLGNEEEKKEIKIGAIIVTPKGAHIPFTARLQFECTNNIAEYEACIMGIEEAIDLRIKNIDIYGDSALVINQIKGEWETRHAGLIPYRDYARRLLTFFNKVELHHIPRDENQMADALATLSSMYRVNRRNETPTIGIRCLERPAYVFATEEVVDNKPWFHDIKMFLQKQEYPPGASNKDRKTLRRLSSGFFLNGEMNGAVEAANKNIKKIVQKMVVTYKDWHEMLPFALHGYRTSVRTSTGATPFSLVYGMEAVLPVEVEIPSMRVLMETELAEAEWCQNRYDQLNLIEEKRMAALCHGQLYQRRMKQAFDRKVRPREFREGDLVLKKILSFQPDSRGKWTPNYEGPYVVKRAFSGGAMTLATMDGDELPRPVNADAVKKYFV
ncbi:unnamed protein product [Trifolium pratense]|uniref:Uncharacterized protein n=1 Tax=Trifolium pratense TaxID=57577 RepID=A0ACB0K6K4_TRIPR|nr:unnamed protein product [Trifolium pratense]